MENHGPSGSLRGLGRRRHRADRSFAELCHRRVADLLAGHGFEIVARHGFGLAPAGSYRSGWSRPLARAVDALSVHIPHAAVATTAVYMARRFDSTYKL
ncbi:hypothetical protein AB0J74_31105 [Asanoa sp. NPDC049573]|uniref:hypothetical protein n=1 Tax=Asanoa sp. NPDC049573 TaxID=3155396 RepID=UPI0034415713